MAVTHKWFRKAFSSAFDKEIDIVADAVYTALLNNVSPSQDNDDYWDDCSTNEASGTGYTANGFDHAAATESVATTLIWSFDLDDAIWATSTITAYFAVVYDTTPGSAATNPLISFVNFDGAQSSSGGDFKVVWNAAGVCKVTVS